MSEYVTVEIEPTGDPNVIELVTNQTLTTMGREVYQTPEEGDVGSPIAQMLFDGIPGILALTITEHSLIFTRESDTPWEQIADDVRDALRDFFL